MANIEEIYESQMETSVVDSLLNRRINSIRRQIERIDRQIASREAILFGQKESHADHVDIVEKYRLKSMSRNSKGEDHLRDQDRMIFDLRREGREIELRAWQDIKDLEKEGRELEEKLYRWIGNKEMIG